MDNDNKAEDYTDELSDEVIRIYVRENRVRNLFFLLLTKLFK